MGEPVHRLHAQPQVRPPSTRSTKPTKPRARTCCHETMRNRGMADAAGAGVTTLVCIIDNGPYTAIVTGTVAGFTLGLACARMMFRQF